MKRIGILTAGGDTPALNRILHGAAVRADPLRMEIFVFVKGFNSLFNRQLPRVRLNLLFQTENSEEPPIESKLLIRFP
jgi:6-phosphofructokinase